MTHIADVQMPAVSMPSAAVVGRNETAARSEFSDPQTLLRSTRIDPKWKSGSGKFSLNADRIVPEGDASKWHEILRLARGQNRARVFSIELA